MKIRLALCTLVLALVAAAPARAQHSDLGNWNTFSFSKGFLDKFSADFDLELRMRDNLSRLNLIYTNWGISYKPVKFFKLSLVYRWIDKYRSEGLFGTRHRFFTDLAFRAKPGRFTLVYRARFQWEYRDARSYGDEFGKQPESYWRNKFDIKYKLNDHWTPYVGTELRFQMHNPRFTYTDKLWDRQRIYAGADYEINHNNSVGAYYLIQREFNVVDPESLYIIGLQYSLSID